MGKRGARLGLSRVDVQVCIIVAVVVALSFLCVYAFNYSVTYREMIETLRERSDSIEGYVDDALDTATFTGIDAAEDMEDESYRAMKEAFKAVRESTGVRYLYTAKRDDEGGFVYVVDGLPHESEDFREPGAPIEEEIVPDMERALAGEVVYPADIKDTGWGYVFVTYYPVHEGNEVVGVLGIEFDAQRQYDTFSIVRVGTPVIAAAFCLLAIAVSFYAFRRVSNPWYRDMANTDYLTGLKNRNAFEVDMANWERSAEIARAGVVSADVDGLKEVNDAHGHAAGDALIKRAAAVVAEACGDAGAVYRVGGDEFTVCCFEMDEERAAALAERIRAACAAERAAGRPLSMSVGWALRLPGERMEDALRRADGRMYEEKRRAKDAR